MQLAAASAWLSGRLDRPRMAALAPGIARLHASSKAKQHSTSISDPPETGSFRSRPIISFADAAASGRNQLKARGRGKTTSAFPRRSQPRPRGPSGGKGLVPACYSSCGGELSRRRSVPFRARELQTPTGMAPGYTALQGRCRCRWFRVRVQFSSDFQKSKPGCYAMKAKACACNLNLLGAFRSCKYPV